MRGVVTLATRTWTIPMSSACQVPSYDTTIVVKLYSANQHYDGRNYIPEKQNTETARFTYSGIKRLEFYRANVIVLDAAANTGGSRLGDWAWKILDRLVIDLSKNVNVIGRKPKSEQSY